MWHKVSIQILLLMHTFQKDNLYKSSFPMQAKALKDSMMQKKEVLGAAVLNNGFSSSYPIGDGQPVFSTSHPIDGGVVANTFTVQADLNETSLETAIVGVQTFKDAADIARAISATAT